MHYVYVLKSKKDGNMYVGYTADLRERSALHEVGRVKSTRTRRLLELVYYESCLGQEDALSRGEVLEDGVWETISQTPTGSVSN